jgi:hypothetical protein
MARGDLLHWRMYRMSFLFRSETELNAYVGGNEAALQQDVSNGRATEAIGRGSITARTVGRGRIGGSVVGELPRAQS